MYLDESSRVLVYWFESHNMLGCYMYIGLWKYTWLHDDNLFGSSLLFACLIACMLFFYFCDDHQFIDGSRCERKSWSTGERWIRYIVFLGWTSCADWAFLLGQWPMCYLAFGLLFLKTLSLFLYVLFWHRGVPWLLYGVAIVLQDCLTYYSTWRFLLIWFIN